MRKIYDLQEKLDSGQVSKDEYDALYEDCKVDSAKAART